MTVFKAIYRPILTFDCESLEKKAFDTKNLRKVGGFIKESRMWNVGIREDLESEFEFI